MSGFGRKGGWMNLGSFRSCIDGGLDNTKQNPTRSSVVNENRFIVKIIDGLSLQVIHCISRNGSLYQRNTLDCRRTHHPSPHYHIITFSTKELRPILSIENEVQSIFSDTRGSIGRQLGMSRHASRDVAGQPAISTTRWRSSIRAFTVRRYTVQ